MIVVDTNVIAYCWIRGDRTELAQRVRMQDRDWHVPVLWRSELRSVLAQHLRQGTLALENATAIMAATESALAGREHLGASEGVLALAARSGVPAYDCEFARLAQVLGVRLVTEDRALLKAFPDHAVNMEAYLIEASTPPAAHSPRARYVVRAPTGRVPSASRPARR